MAKFEELFGLQVRHDYYENRRCSDLAFAPFASTHEHLQGLRLWFAATQDGFRISCESKRRAHALNSLANQVLKFSIATTNSEFQYFTNADWFCREQNAIHFLSNRAPRTSFSPSRTIDSQAASPGARPITQHCIAARKRSEFALQIAANETDADEDFVRSLRTVQLQHVYDSTASRSMPLEQIGKADADAIAIAQFDMSRAHSGLHRVVTQPESAAFQRFLYVADEPKLSEPCLGVLELHMGRTPEPVRYELTFNSRSSRWAYLLPNEDSDGVEIVDAEFSETTDANSVIPDRFKPMRSADRYRENERPLVFQRVTGNTERAMARFEADRVLPFFESPRRNLLLTKIGRPGYFQSLPNPPIRSVRPENKEDPSSEWIAESVVHL